MEAVIHLDTHVVAWLWAGDAARLRPVKRRLERSELVISPMVTLELQLLYEIGRVTEPADAVVAHLVERAGLRQSPTPLSRVVAQALGMTWTRDPFDRIIAAHAQCDGARLLTRDDTIRSHCPFAVWPG
jgi:PIN domain nuclease of toxin-antitoxin system